MKKLKSYKKLSKKTIEKIIDSFKKNYKPIDPLSLKRIFKELDNSVWYVPWYIITTKNYNRIDLNVVDSICLNYNSKDKKCKRYKYSKICIGFIINQKYFVDSKLLLEKIQKKTLYKESLYPELKYYSDVFASKQYKKCYEKIMNTIKYHLCLYYDGNCYYVISFEENDVFVHLVDEKTKKTIFLTSVKYSNRWKRKLIKEITKELDNFGIEYKTNL